MAASVLEQILENLRGGAVLPIEESDLPSIDTSDVVKQLLMTIDQSLQSILDTTASRPCAGPQATTQFSRALAEIWGVPDAACPSGFPTEVTGAVPSAPTAPEPANAETLEQIRTMIAERQAERTKRDQSSMGIPLDDIQNMIELLK